MDMFVLWVLQGYIKLVGLHKVSWDVWVKLLMDVGVSVKWIFKFLNDQCSDTCLFCILYHLIMKHVHATFCRK